MRQTEVDGALRRAVDRAGTAPEIIGASRSNGAVPRAVHLGLATHEAAGSGGAADYSIP